MIDEEQNAVPAGNWSKTPNGLHDTIFEDPKIVFTKIGHRLVHSIVDSDFH
jgi:hypothetical protein